MSRGVRDISRLDGNANDGALKNPVAILILKQADELCCKNNDIQLQLKLF
jgi:hypothetical protein